MLFSVQDSIMEKIKKFNKNYINDEINKVEKQFLYEENLKLKQEIEKEHPYMVLLF